MFTRISNYDEDWLNPTQQPQFNKLEVLTRMVYEHIHTDTPVKMAYGGNFYKPTLQKISEPKLIENMQFIADNLQMISRDISKKDNIKTLFEYMQAMGLINRAADGKHGFTYSFNEERIRSYWSANFAVADAPESDAVEAQGFTMTTSVARPLVYDSQTDIPELITSIINRRPVNSRVAVALVSVWVNYDLHFHRQLEASLRRIFEQGNNINIQFKFSFSGKKEEIQALARVCLPSDQWKYATADYVKDMVCKNMVSIVNFLKRDFPTKAIKIEIK